MHNLHFIKVNAYDYEEAASNVGHLVDNFGGENNWWRIVGVLSLDHQYFPMDERGWAGECSSIKKINDYIKSDIESYESLKLVLKNIKDFSVDSLPNLSSEELRAARRYITYLEDCRDFKSHEFNILVDTYKPHQFDDIGVTDDTYEGSNGPVWIVIIDMHS